MSWHPADAVQYHNHNIHHNHHNHNHNNSQQCWLSTIITMIIIWSVDHLDNSIFPDLSIRQKPQYIYFSSSLHNMFRLSGPGHVLQIWSGDTPQLCPRLRRCPLDSGFPSFIIMMILMIFMSLSLLLLCILSYKVTDISLVCSSCAPLPGRGKSPWWLFWRGGGPTAFLSAGLHIKQGEF